MMNAINKWIHNFFHENKSTLNGLFLLALSGAVYRFGGFDASTASILVTALVAAAIKFLTGSDNGTPKPPASPTV